MIDRYSLPEIAYIWSDENYYNNWLKIELAYLWARVMTGELSEEVYRDIESKAKVDVNRIHEIENTTRHNVIAFLTQLEECVGENAKRIHEGLTSSDTRYMSCITITKFFISYYQQMP